MVLKWRGRRADKVVHALVLACVTPREREICRLGNIMHLVLYRVLRVDAVWSAKGDWFVLSRRLLQIFASANKRSCPLLEKRLPISTCFAIYFHRTLINSGEELVLDRREIDFSRALNRQYITHAVLKSLIHRRLTTRESHEWYVHGSAPLSFYRADRG